MRRISSITTVVFLLISSVCFGASSWMTRPGTIADAITHADDSHVYLDAVQITKIRASDNPAYFVVRESMNASDKIIVLTQPSPELRPEQIVDIEGDLTTLENGNRAITNATVYGYTDLFGNLLYHPAVWKGFLDPTPWSWKTDLTIYFNLNSPNTALSSIPNPSDPDPSPALTAAACSTISEAKGKDVGTPVELICKPIASIGSNYFIMGEDNSSNQIKVYSGKMVSTDDRVLRVSGTIQTEGTDKVLTVDSNGPGFNPQVFEGRIVTLSPGSIAFAKTWPDGHTFVADDISAKIITRNWTDYFYIEDDNRASGIRVEKAAHGRVKGERVDVIGSIATDGNGERYIAADTVPLNGTGTVNPLGMSNKNIGWRDCEYTVNLESGPVTLHSRVGVNNIGLLVRAWGRITQTGTDWFAIDDGSGVGVKVTSPPPISYDNDVISILGISSCESDTNDVLYRVLRTPPLTCTITKAAGQDDTTTTSPVNFAVTFNEPVTGFTGNGVNISSTAARTGSPVVTPIGTDGTQYNVAVSGFTSGGTVIAHVRAGAARSSSGIWNEASTSYEIQLNTSVPTTPASATATWSGVDASSTFNATWPDCTDSVSGISGYEYCIEKDNNVVVDWTTVSSNSISLTDQTLGISDYLKRLSVYCNNYLKVRAVNRAGIKSEAISVLITTRWHQTFDKVSQWVPGQGKGITPDTIPVDCIPTGYTLTTTQITSLQDTDWTTGQDGQGNGALKLDQSDRFYYGVDRFPKNGTISIYVNTSTVIVKQSILGAGYLSGNNAIGRRPGDFYLEFWDFDPSRPLSFYLEMFNPQISDWSRISGPDEAAKNTWYKLAVSFGSAGMQIYINGVPIENNLLNIPRSDSGLFLGACPFLSLHWPYNDIYSGFQGLVDDLETSNIENDQSLTSYP